MKKLILSVLGVLLLALISCGSQENEDTPSTQPIKRDLAEIRKSGKLKVITLYNPTSYFIYKGQPMGYEYELLERLSDWLSLDVEYVLADNLEDMFEMLSDGRGDMIAYELTVTKDRKNLVAFTTYHTLTQQMLVQRKPGNWRKMTLDNIDRKLIRNQIDLAGKTVHVVSNSAYEPRLKSLSDEIGADINVVSVGGKTETSDLISQVAAGEIDYTVADLNIASINQTYYSNIDIATPVSFPQQLAWAVRQNSPELLNTVNEWIDEIKKDTDYYVIYNKYFKNKKDFVRRVKSEFFSKNSGKISPYDDLIRQHAQALGWDWRLLASQVYQESKFDPKAKSWVGAMGLMQMMPATAKQFKVGSLTDPEESIKGGVAYLQYLWGYWDNIPDSTERVKFVLASYNVGPGHVADARKLTQKYGGDKDVWNKNVAKYLRLKSSKEYFTDEVVKHGYCRGQEPYRYVRETLARYEHYAASIPLDPEEASEEEAPEGDITYDHSADFDLTGKYFLCRAN